MGMYIELISNLIQMFILTWFISNFFGYKHNGATKKISFLCVWLISFVEISFINHIIVYDGFLSGLLILTYIIYSHYFLKGSFFFHIFISFLSAAIIFTVSSIILFVGSSLSGHTVEDLIVMSSVWRNTMMVSARIIEFALFSFVIKANNEYKLTKKEWILFVAMPILTWTAVTIMTKATILSKEILPHMFYISLIIIAINIITYFFMFKIKEDSNTIMKYELLKMQYNNILNTEENMKALYESTYSLKHDLDKHLFAVKELADKNACSEISSYIKHIIKDTEKSVQKVVFTDNDIFNAVINTKLELCKQNNIVTIVNIDNSAVTYLDNKYISVLFGNLLDNAIEAAEKAELKLINISVTQKGNYISVCTENTYNKNFSDTTLKTTKKNDVEHGFGTKNIRKVVEENNGMIQYFTNENDLFCCDILLEKEEI